MARHSSLFSHLLRRLFHGAPSRRARCTLQRSRTPWRLTLEELESRVLLSSYVIQDLGTLGGATSQATAINAEGEVVGSAQLANGTTHAVLWAPGQPAKDLLTLGGANSFASAINIHGEIVGSADTASPPNQPFDLPPGGAMTSLNSELPSSVSLGSSFITATGVNDIGVIVGQFQFNFIDPSPPRPYSFDPPSGTLNQLDDSDTSGQATAVSGNMAVATLTNFFTGKTQAVVEDITKPDSSVALPAIFNQVSSEVLGLSAPTSALEPQFAVGEATDSFNVTHLVLWTIPPNDFQSATVLDLSSLPSSLSGGAANAVNAERDVVGTAFDQGTGQADAFVAFGGEAPVSLNSLVLSGSGITLTNATGINDSGQICADGTINGQQHAFLLTPLPTAPPQATLTNAPDINTAGAATYSFTVTYTDETGIDASTLANAIQVTGPNGFSQTASLASSSGTPNQLAATYTISAPGGIFDFTDNGTYTISLNNNVVKNVTGQPLAGGTLGHFVAAINVPRGSISGTVFDDVNNFGSLEPGDPGVPNVDVFIDLNGDGHLDSGDPVTQTDGNGKYSFNGLLPGTYNVMEAVVDSQLVTSPSNDVHVVTVSAGFTSTGVNFGDVANPVAVSIDGQPLFINGFPVAFQGKTAQFDQPATTLDVAGINFSANDIFYFGNDLATASPTNLQTPSISSGLQTFDLQVPELATTGPIVFFDPQSNRFTTLLSTFTVNSYRNVNGFSFDNDGNVPDENANNPNFTFTELTDVYGADQTEINLFGDEVHNPLANLELAVINALLPPCNGLCVGFSVASARLSLGLTPSYGTNSLPEFIGDFPTTDIIPNTTSTVSQLTNSDSLRELIRLAHLEQTSDEFLGNFLQQVIADEEDGVSNLIDEVKSQLAQGLPVPICFYGINGDITSGHCVLVYNVQDNPNGSETLDIYDPDLPFDQGSEEDGKLSTLVPAPFGIKDGTAHMQDAQNSTITFGTDGHWIYDGGAGKASGGLGSIGVAPLSVFNNHTLLVDPSSAFASDADLAGNPANLIEDFASGSAAETQVTDSSGHKLLNADGSPNTNPNTLIPNAARYVDGLNSVPLDLIEGTGNFMQTITGTGSGTYTAGSFGPNAMAMISGVATVNGQIDQFGLNSSSDMLTFIPGANKELNAELIMNAADGSQRQAQLSSTASSKATQTLQFQGSDVIYHDAGGAGSFSLSLTSDAGGTEQTFTTGRMTLAAGDSVNILPSSWTNLQTATATVVVTHANGSKTTSTIANGGQGLKVSAKESVSFTAPVAGFTNQTAAGKSAVIDWGDGTTSTGTVTDSGANVTVTGSHTYAQPGYYSTSTTLSDANGPLEQATGEAVVSFTTFTLAGATITEFAGVPFSGTLATLTDMPSGEDATDFDVNINWGDGTTSAGTLQTTSAGQFDVQGTHTFATTGIINAISVTVTLIGDTSGQGQTLNIGSDTSFSGTLAQLQLPIPGSAPSDYVATINWGDNTTSTGTLTLQADGSVILSGSHSYATANKSFVTSFTLTGGPAANAIATALVNPAVGTVSGTLFDDVNGNGTMASREVGIPNQTVFIDEKNDGKLDPGDPFAITNSAGVYTITNVPAGNVHVSEVVPSNFRVDAPAAGSYNLTLNPGQTLSNLNFANTQLALISGTVFVDSNGNGKLDPSETGRANQIVYLDLSNNGVLEPNDPTAITDATGAFAFTVFPGTYVVRLQSFPTYMITTPAGGAYSVTVGDGATNSGGLFGELLLNAPPVQLESGGHLLVKGNGKGNAITLGASAAGVIMVSFNGMPFTFAPGQVSSIEVDTASAGGAVVTVLATPASVPLVVNAGASSDAVQAGATLAGTVGAILGPLTVNGKGSSRFTVFDQGSTTAETYTLTGTPTGGEMLTSSDGLVVTCNTVSSLIVNGGSGADQFEDQVPVTSSVTFNGGSGSNSLSATEGVGHVTTWLITGPGSGIVGKRLTFTGISNLVGTTNVDNFEFFPGGSIAGTITGGSGLGNFLSYANESGPVAVNLQTGAAPQIAGGAPGGFSGITLVEGSTSAKNTLIGPDANTTWTIKAANGGSGVAGSFAFSFSGIQNLVGGAGVDVFTFAATGSLSGSLNGGGAPLHQGNWLSYSALATPVTVNLQKGTATGVAGGVTNIQNVHGGNGGNTLTGDSQGNVLVGGSGPDRITGGSGVSLLIGDLGADTITGGSGGDILIGDAASFDTMTAANEKALMAILAEWQSADSYATRFNDINTGTGGGLNGTFKLNFGTTVKDDGATDILTAAPSTAALDWFFKGTGDVLKNVESGEFINNNTPAAFQDRTVTSPVPAGSLVTLSGTITDPNLGDSFTLIVNWGDGTRAQRYTFPRGSNGRRVSVTHRYGEAGNYTIALSWTDPTGPANHATLPVTVN